MKIKPTVCNLKIANGSAYPHFTKKYDTSFRIVYKDVKSRNNTKRSM